MKRRLLSLLLIATAIGCTSDKLARQFRVVDRTSGEPIGGVLAEGSYRMPTAVRHVQTFGPYWARSDEDGLLHFEEAFSSDQEISFVKEGYERCTIKPTPKEYRSGKWPSRHDHSWEDEETAVIELQPLADK